MSQTNKKPKSQETKPSKQQQQQETKNVKYFKSMNKEAIQVYNFIVKYTKIFTPSYYNIQNKNV